MGSLPHRLAVADTQWCAALPEAGPPAAELAAIHTIMLLHWLVQQACSRLACKPGSPTQSQARPANAIGCRGDEPRLVADFKGVLGLEDKAAAEVHMNLARRLLREKAEQRKGGGAEQRKVRSSQPIFWMLCWSSTPARATEGSSQRPWTAEGVSASTDPQRQLMHKAQAEEFQRASSKDIHFSVRHEPPE